MAGSSPEQASRSLSEHYALSSQAASSYVADVLRQYETLGDQAAPPSPGPVRKAADAHALLDGNARHPGPIAHEVSRTYRLLDCLFEVRYGTTRLLENIHPLLEPLFATAAVDGAAIVDLAIVPAGEGIDIMAGCQVVGTAHDISTAAVATRACLAQIAIARSGGFCVLHAGALRRDGEALLLPGEAGHGKSTLSAGLSGKGYEMLCDDTTLLLGDPPRVRSLPCGLCIKRGAYAVLERHFCELRLLPEWRRPDGQWARYLRPGRDLNWAGPDATEAVRWIVFPRYRREGATTLRPLARHEALARLLRGVFFLSGVLDAANVEKLVAWIAPIDCFDLQLSSLDRATALIEKLRS